MPIHIVTYGFSYIDVCLYVFLYIFLYTPHVEYCVIMFRLCLGIHHFTGHFPQKSPIITCRESNRLARYKWCMPKHNRIHLHIEFVMFKNLKCFTLWYRRDSVPAAAPILVIFMRMLLVILMRMFSDTYTHIYHLVMYKHILIAYA